MRRAGLQILDETPPVERLCVHNVSDACRGVERGLWVKNLEVIGVWGISFSFGSMVDDKVRVQAHASSLASASRAQPVARTSFVVSIGQTLLPPQALPRTRASLNEPLS